MDRTEHGWTFTPDVPTADPNERSDRDAATFRKLAAHCPNVV